MKDSKRVFINPEIVEVGPEEKTMDEGCLSLPGISEAVSRSTMVRVKYRDENWQEHDEVFHDYFAKAVQHENEHLDGKMFIDHLSPIRKQMNKSRLHSMLIGKHHFTINTQSTLGKRMHNEMRKRMRENIQRDQLLHAGGAEDVVKTEKKDKDEKEVN